MEKEIKIKTDIQESMDILEKDHYGLEEVRENCRVSCCSKKS